MSDLFEEVKRLADEHGIDNHLFLNDLYQLMEEYELVKNVDESFFRQSKMKLPEKMTGKDYRDWRNKTSKN